MKRMLCLLLLVLPLLLAAESLTLTLDLNPPAAMEDEAYLSSGYGIINSPGSPRLPYKQLNILLPPGAGSISQSAAFSSEMRLSGAAPQINQGYQSSAGSISRQAVPMPQSRINYLGIKRWGEMLYVSYRVLPAVYEGGWSWSSKLQLSISYELTHRDIGKVPPTFNEAAFFANPQAINSYYDTQRPDPEQYLIITTQELMPSTYILRSLRQADFTIGFAYIDNVLAESTGANDAEKLRNYLIQRYANLPFKYLLLVGDVDTIPTAYLTPEPGGSDSVPSDFYYSDLSSIWDTNSNGLLGEYYSMEGEGDWLVDYTPECFVGRIPTNDSAEVQAICQRIVSFEYSTADWKNKALLPAAYLNYAGEPIPDIPLTDGAGFMEYIRSTLISGMQSTTLYEQEGVLPSYPSDYPLDPTVLKNLLSEESWGLLNWSAHGSATSSSRKVWMADHNGNQMADDFEMEWIGMVNRSSFDNLVNTDGTVLFAASCYNGMVDYHQPSLGEYSLIKKTVASIAATRTGWYKIGWQNPGWGGLSSYNYHWLEQYKRHGRSVGEAQARTNLLHTQIYLYGDPVDDGGVIWPELQNVYTYMLFGDPAIGYSPSPVPTGKRYFIYEPVGNEGIRLQNTLHEVDPGCIVVHSNVLIPIGYYNPQSYLEQFDAVYCLMGHDGLGYGINPGTDIYTQLDSYLEGGGKLYLEGAAPWDQPSSLWNKFAINPMVSGEPYILNSIWGRDEYHNYLWDYETANIGTSFTPGFGGSVVFFSAFGGNPGDPIGIYTASPSGWATLGASFELASVSDSPSTYSEMIALINRYLFWGPPMDTEEAIPTPSLQLSAYPNPFNPLTRISFALPSSGRTRLELFNIRGQKIADLLDSHLVAGEHSLQLDTQSVSGRALAGGIYLLRLSSPGSKRSLKLVLLK